MKPENNPQSGKKPTFLQLVGSVLSAVVGIQSRKNHERDINHGKMSTFVIAGSVYAALFIATITGAVHLVLKHAGL